MVSFMYIHKTFGSRLQSFGNIVSLEYIFNMMIGSTIPDTELNDNRNIIINKIIVDSIIFNLVSPLYL